MIKNERQYRITKAQAAKFAAALDAAVARENVDPQLRQLEEDALRSQLEELCQELDTYERLRSSWSIPIRLDSFEQFPRALVQARIAAGLSQKDLATRLGLKEQQIQRYEATEYTSASLKRIKEVLEALGANVTGELTCTVAADDPTEGEVI